MTGKIKLYGDSSFNFVVANENDFSSEERQMIDSNTCSDWDLDTQFRIDFTNGLVAGNATFGNYNPSSFFIYRQRENEDLELAAIIDGDRTSFIDYAVKNNSNYSYYVYPASDDYLGSPIHTNSTFVFEDYWVLLACDETDQKNIYKMSEIFYFDKNPENVTVNNNTSSNILRTFSKYMQVQKCSTNSLSGQLSALIGGFDAKGNYIETIEQFDKIIALSTDERQMFLRDVMGHIYKVEISAEISGTQTVYLNGITNMMTVQWQESGSSSGILITN